MSASHTGDLTTPGLLLGPGVGFGLGFSVVTDLAATQALGSEGMFGWSGIYGTNFWVDPKEKLVAIVMVQKYRTRRSLRRSSRSSTRRSPAQ